MRFSLILLLLSATVFPNASSSASPAEGGSGGVTSGAGPAHEKSAASPYPFVYRRVGYLATTGPAPMRFGPLVPGGSERTPPRIAAPKKPELSRTAEGMARTEAIESYRSIFGRGIPVPPGSPEGGPRIPDAFLDSGSGSGMGGGNNEVLEFFQQPSLEPDAQKRQNRYLFDPVFQAAKPPATGGVPQSRATYGN